MVRAKPAEKAEALGYVRTSSAANLGVDKDSETRQRLAIERYATTAGFAIVGWYHDAAVSGADPVETRPGFAAMLDQIEGNGVRVVLVEDASRFARSVIAQELGVLVMQERGVRVLTAGGEDLTATDDPAKVMMRQIAGAFAQYEKARLVQKLRGARDRRSAERGRRVEGRKGYGETSPACWFSRPGGWRGAARRRVRSGRCGRSRPSWSASGSRTAKATRLRPTR